MGKMALSTDPADVFSILADSTQILTSLVPMTDETVQISWKPATEFVDSSPFTNVVIASYTTAIARMKLYSLLETLGDRVLYFDTGKSLPGSCRWPGIEFSDSVVYRLRPGDQDLPSGSFLGDLTDELEGFGEGAFINSFASCGPKSYGFLVTNDAGDDLGSVVKVKGIRLTSSARKKVHFHTLVKHVEAFVQEGQAPDTKVVYPQIRRQKDRTVITQTEMKKFRLVYDKRWVMPDYGTLPFGWKE